MEVVLFTLVAIVLYVISDSIIKFIEKQKGDLLKHRSIIFFVIITVLAVASFNLIRIYGPELGILPKPATDVSPQKPEEG